MRNLKNEKQIEIAAPEHCQNDIMSEKDSYGHVWAVNIEIRQKYPNSYFWPKVYDDCIRGVNVLTGSIIYDYMAIGARWIATCEGNAADLDDVFYGSVEMELWLKNLTPEELGGKVPPTLIFQCLDMDYFDDWKFISAHWGEYRQNGYSNGIELESN